MIHSFLLIGQSNMAGRGFLNEAKEIDTSHIKVLRNGRWQTMFRPVILDRDVSGVCLAESFAECYAKKYDVDVGLIGCADGGTSLDQWAPDGVLYRNAIFQAKLAMESSTLAGILWHQGEADCFEGLHTTYEYRLAKFIESLRKDIGIPDIPIVMGGLGDFLKSTSFVDYQENTDTVNKATENVAKADSLTGFANAKGLTANPDNVHFNAESLYELGIRYFNEFETLKKRDGLFTE